VAEPS